MGFIVGKAYPIIKSMADGGNQEAKNLLNGLDKMDQSKVDEMVSSLLGGGKKNKPSSFTDVAESFDLGDTDDIPKGSMPKNADEQKVMSEKLQKDAELQKKELKLMELGDTDDIPKSVMPKTAAEQEELRKLLLEISPSKKSQVKDPLSEENLQELFDAGLDVDEVIDKVRKQMSEVELSPDDPLSAGDLQGVVEAFEMSYKPKPKKPESFTELVSQDGEMLSPKTDEEKKEFNNAYENAVANRGEKGAKRLFNKTKKMLKAFGVKNFADQLDFFIGMINDEKGMRGK